MNTLRRRTDVSAAAILCGAVVMCADIHTAAAQSATPAEDTAGAGLGEVVVTAQRRSERAQDTPITVTALSADQMGRVGLVSSADLPAVIPGLTIFPSGSRSPIYLRGVGNNGVSTSPSVLTFVDGVYQPFDNSGAFFPNNIESIEVAKGPQGTLFGRNATGGVILITTKDPFASEGVDLELGLANFSTVTTKIYAANAFSDEFAADISAFYDRQNEGWGENIANGRDYYKSENYGYRGKVVARPTETFTATVAADYAYRWGHVGVGGSPSGFNGMLFNAVTGTTFSPPSIYDIASETMPFYRSREGGLALTLEKEFGEITVLSITSYREASEFIDIDFDEAPVHAIDLRRRDERSAVSQELQVSGGGDSHTWVAGLYYFDMRDDIDGPKFTGIFFPNGFNIQSVDTDTAYAAYAQGTMEILPDTKLTLGARYTVEDREIEGNTATGSGFVIPSSIGSQSATFKEPNYRVALDHKFTPDILGYVSWTRGFNAGFFNQISFGGFTDAANPLVLPEEVNAYEVGVKSQFFDNRLLFNIAAFQYEYENLQQQVYSPGGIFVVNAAAATINGVDFELTARPIPELTLSLSGNYLDTQYDSYPSAPDFVFAPNGRLEAAGSRDASGNEIVNAPKFGLQASATHTLTTEIGFFETTVNVNYQDEFYSDPQNYFPIAERTLVGVNERWISMDGDTSITLWVKNLTDEEYDLSYSLLAGPGLVNKPGAPRTYGITLSRHF